MTKKREMHENLKRLLIRMDDAFDSKDARKLKKYAKKISHFSSVHYVVLNKIHDTLTIKDSKAITNLVELAGLMDNIRAQADVIEASAGFIIGKGNEAMREKIMSEIETSYPLLEFSITEATKVIEEIHPYIKSLLYELKEKNRELTKAIQNIDRLEGELGDIE